MEFVRNQDTFAILLNRRMGHECAKHDGGF